MGIKEWIIRRLEKDVEFSAGHIELEALSDEDRKKAFRTFGEGDSNLEKFLEVAYNNGAPSIFCCSGHGVRPAYITLKVTDGNIELLRKVGKVLSNMGVVTNFTDDHIRGKYVAYHGRKTISTLWLDIASKILEHPELYDDSNPSIYYHEEMYQSYIPLGFNLKKKILSYLKGQIKELPTRK